jgi:hypothetical protein
MRLAALFDIWQGLDPNNLNFDSPKILIANVIRVALSLGIILAGIMIVLAGIQYITSAGDPGRIAKAKTTITNAIVGLLIAVFAIMIINTITGAF